MNDYTVLLLRPDDIADVFGQDTIQCWVSAEDVDQARARARVDAVSTDEYDDDPMNYFVLGIYQGHLEDLNY